MWTRETAVPVLNIPRHLPKLHIWGGISARGTSVLKIFKQNFDSHLYIETLS